MDGQPKNPTFNKHPDILNIDMEYVENLKFLLESSPYKEFVRPESVAITNNKKNNHQSDVSFDNFASICSKKNLPIPPSDSNFKEDPLYARLDYDPKAILDRRNSVSFVQDAVRAYHANFFQAKKEDIHNTAGLVLSNPISNPVSQSKSPGKRNLSLRIQSLLENFESVNRQNDTSIGSPADLSWATRKRHSKIGSLDASFSDTKSTAEACFICSKVIYPLDRFSNGSRVYHKSCLRCSVCGRGLSPGTCESAKDELFCRPHFLEKAHGIFRKMSVPSIISR